MMTKRALRLFFLLACGYFLFPAKAPAEEVTVLFTGESHAMLYPCNCPIEPDGGVSRRAALVKQLRKENPNALLFDTGAFFAGGITDEYSQNTQLDMQRTQVNLKAMELMSYDAVCVGDEEFNFGREFFEENIGKARTAVLSSNMVVPPGSKSKVLPYVIKETAGIKFGVIGVTSLAAGQKAGGIKFSEPVDPVKDAVGRLKAKGADIIVLLSHLGEEEDLRLIKQVAGIDVLIVGHSRKKPQTYDNQDGTLILRPVWQARRLGRLSLTVENKKIADYRVEELRLSDKVGDDPEALSFLPACFSDTNCRKEGFTGTCQKPGAPDAKCVFAKASEVKLLVITAKSCSVCDTDKAVNFLKRHFPALAVSYLYYPDKQAAEMIGSLGIQGLPAYLLGKEADKERPFGSLKENVEARGGYYMLKPEFSGVSYFPRREIIKGKLDLFISLYHKDAKSVLEAAEEFSPDIHFLVTQRDGGFEAEHGRLEAEESLRSVCVQKYYPQGFLGYIGCRAKNVDSSWWEDCLAPDLNADKIRACARGEEGAHLLRANTQLNKELKVMYGPAYLMDNREIFGSQGAPAKEELRKVIKQR